MACSIPWYLIFIHKIVLVYITNDSRYSECHIKLMEKYRNQ